MKDEKFDATGCHQTDGDSQHDYTRREIFEIVNAIASLNMTKIDAGDRHTLNALESTIQRADQFLIKFQFGTLKK